MFRSLYYLWIFLGLVVIANAIAWFRHTQPIKPVSVSFSHDGKFLAAIFSDLESHRFVRIWRLTDEGPTEHLTEFEDYESSIADFPDAVRFVDDSRLLFLRQLLSTDRSTVPIITMLDVKTGAKKGLANNHPQIELNSKPVYLTCDSQIHELFMYSMDSQTPVKTFRFEQLATLHPSGDFEKFVTSHGDNIEVMDIQSGEQLGMFRDPSSEFGNPTIVKAVSESGRFVAMDDWRYNHQRTRIVELIDGEVRVVATPMSPEFPIAIAFSGIDDKIVGVLFDDKFQIWDLEKGTRIHNVERSFAASDDFAFSHDGEWIAVASSDLSIWNAKTMEQTELVWNLTRWDRIACGAALGIWLLIFAGAVLLKRHSPQLELEDLQQELVVLDEVDLDPAEEIIEAEIVSSARFDGFNHVCAALVGLAFFLGFVLLVALGRETAYAASGFFCENEAKNSGWPLAWRSEGVSFGDLFLDLLLFGFSLAGLVWATARVLPNKPNWSLSISTMFLIIGFCATIFALSLDSNVTLISFCEPIVTMVFLLGLACGFVMIQRLAPMSKRSSTFWKRLSIRVASVHPTTWLFGLSLFFAFACLNVTELQNLTGRGSFPSTVPKDTYAGQNMSSGFSVYDRQEEAYETSFFGYPLRAMDHMNPYGSNEESYIWEADFFGQVDFTRYFFNLIFGLGITFGAAYTVEKIQRNRALSNRDTFELIVACFLLVAVVVMLRIWAEYPIFSPPKYLSASLALVGLVLVWPAVMGTIAHTLKNKSRSQMRTQSEDDDSEFLINRIFAESDEQRAEQSTDDEP